MKHLPAPSARRYDCAFVVDGDNGDDSSLPMLQHLGDCSVFRAESQATSAVDANAGKYFA
jgi:hypothetical protein